MKSKAWLIAACLASFVAFHESDEARAAIVLDITTEDAAQAATTQGGVDFVVTNLNVTSSGSGLISPFLNISGIAGPATQGYNSDRPTGEFDERSNFTRSLLINEVPQFSLGQEVVGEFLLDIGEPNNQNSLLSLNQVQIFAATAAYATDANLATTGIIDANGTPIVQFDPANTVEVFRMSDSMTQYEVLLDAALGAGGGQFDMTLFVDFGLVNSLPSEFTHFIFYSHFGSPPGSAAQNPLFEEWAVGEIPEPSTWALLLITACAALFFQYRHQHKLKRAVAGANSADDRNS